MPLADDALNDMAAGTTLHGNRMVEITASNIIIPYRKIQLPRTC